MGQLSTPECQKRLEVGCRRSPNWLMKLIEGESELSDETEPLEDGNFLKVYKFVMTPWEFFYGLLGVSFGPPRKSNRHENHDQSFVTYISWPKGKSETSWRRALIYLIIRLYVHFVMIQCSSIAWLQINHDILLKQWQPTNKQGGTPVLRPLCAPVESQQDKDTIASILKLRSLLEILGNPIFDTIGAMWASTWSATSIAFAVVAFYIIKLKPFRIDFNCFAQNPSQEWCIAKYELGLINESLIESARLYAQNQRQFVDFESILNSIYQRDLAKPITLGKSWHRRLLYLMNNGLLITIIHITILTLFLPSILLCSELLILVDRRLKLIECTRLMPDIIPSKYIALPLNELNRDDHRQAYDRVWQAGVDQLSWLGRFSLAIGVELYYELTGWKLCSYIQMAMAGFVVITMIHFFIGAYIFGVIDRLVWVRQLDDQLYTVVELLELRRSELNKEQNQHDKQQLDQQLTKSALIAYVNYTTFHLRFIHYRYCSSLLVNQVTYLAVETMAFGYLVFLKTDVSSAPAISIGYFYLIIAFNIYIMSAAHLFGRLSSVYNKIQKTLALLAYQPNEATSFITGLWRRHLLSRNEFEGTYAFYLLGSFGPTVSYGELLTFNAYMIGLILLMFRI